MSIFAERILFEDDYILAVNKLARELVVHGKGKGQVLPLLDYLQKDYPGLKPINRLDFETSGVVLFAKNPAVLKQFIADDFKGLQKKYVTIVKGHAPKNKTSITKPLPARTKGLVPAETRYTVLETFGNSSYLEVEMLTGRHHQIRLHMASIGHPLLLDSLYGHKQFNGIFTQEFKLRDFFLHAAEVTFIHPITKESITIKAPLPVKFAKILKALRALV